MMMMILMMMGDWDVVGCSSWGGGWLCAHVITQCDPERPCALHGVSECMCARACVYVCVCVLCVCCVCVLCVCVFT
jgi:hypothetical protein